MSQRSFRLGGSMRSFSRRSSLMLPESSLFNSAFDDSKDSNSLSRALLTTARLVPVSVINHFIKEKFEDGVVPYVESFEAAVLFADISGFSSLAEKLVNKSGNTVKSAEELSKYIGKSLNLMVRTVAYYGGDVIKFAGDAILVLFKATDFNDSLEKATACALYVALKVIDLELRAGDVKLAVHCGIGAGEVFGNHIGGLYNRWEYVITGDTISQVGNAEPEANPGEVVLSNKAYKLIKDDINCTILESGNVLVLSFQKDVKFKRKPLVLEYLADLKDIAEIKRLSFFLRCYIPRPVIIAIECNKGDWIAELRYCSIVFCRVLGLTFNSIIDLKVIQNALFTIQNYIYKYEGTLCRFIVDDKGAGILFAFGLPPYMHENDALRAVKASYEISKEIKRINNPLNDKKPLDVTLGVTTGRVFCGTVGGSTRCEYTLHGTLVNLAARFMVAAQNGILVSEETYEETKNDIKYNEPRLLKVKGKDETVKAFCPVSIISKELHLQDTITGLIDLPGREEQHELIKEVIGKLSHGSLSRATLVIEGEAGTGKTYCTKYAHRTAIETQNVTFMHSKAIDTETAKPYFMWKSIFRQLLAAHYTKTLGQYFYFEKERPSKAVYLGSKSNDYKYPISFFEKVVERGMPSFEALPTELKAQVLHDMVSGLPKEHNDYAEQLYALLPDYFDDLLIESKHRYNIIDFGLISSCLNEIFAELKGRKSSNVVDGFRKSIQGILVKKEVGSIATVDTEGSFRNIPLDQTETKISSVFGFAKRKKQKPSTSLTLNNERPLSTSVEKNTSTKSEPPMNVLFSTEFLGGSKEVFISGFLRLSQSRKLILCFEDIEYADQYSLELLESLMHNQSSCLFIFSLRSFTNLNQKLIDFFKSCDNGSFTRKTKLKNLSHSELREAISLWTQVEIVHDEVVNLVYERSEGQPFFSEELVKLLLNRKYIVTSKEKCVLSEKAKGRSIDIPNNISSLIVTKLDRLSPRELDILKTISVFEGSFSKSEIYAVVSAYQSETSTHEDQISFYKTCRALRDHGLLVETGSLVSIQNSLLRESAYGLLLYQERKDLHLIIAQRLLQDHESYVDMVVDKLSRHFFLAEEYITAFEKKKESYAITFLEVYCEKCRERQDNQQAYVNYKSLLSIADYAKKIGNDGEELESSIIRRAKWYIEFSKAAFAIGNTEEAIDNIKMALFYLEFPLILPSKLDLFFRSTRQLKGSTTLVALLQDLVSLRKFHRIVVIANAFTVLAVCYEQNNISYANFVYSLGSKAIYQLQQLIIQGQLKGELGEIYDAIIDFTSSYGLFNIKFFNKKLFESNESMKLALGLRKKGKEQSVRLKVLLHSIEHAVLGGSLVDVQVTLQEACWTAKFLHTLDGIVKAYSSSIRVALYRGRIVHAYYLAVAAAQASLSEKLSRWKGFLGAKCQQFHAAQKELFNLCRIPPMKLTDDKLMNVVLKKKDPWACYIFASLLHYKANEHFKGYVVLSSGIEVLLNETAFKPSLICLSLNSIILICEMFPTLSLKKLVSRRSSKKVSPNPDDGSVSLDYYSFKDISLLSSLLKAIRYDSKRYICYAAQWRYCSALIEEQTTKSMKTRILLFERVYHVAARNDQSYICALCCKHLYRLGKTVQKSNEVLEKYKLAFERHISDCEEFVAEASVRKIPNLTINEKRILETWN